jgi:GH24 family phage-related lysozyme (muramidase)
MLLANDIRIAEQAVTHLVRVALTQGQFDALVDFVLQPRLAKARRVHAS